VSAVAICDRCPEDEWIKSFESFVTTMNGVAATKMNGEIAHVYATVPDIVGQSDSFSGNG
jgi:hypothetical protein